MIEIMERISPFVVLIFHHINEITQSVDRNQKFFNESVLFQNWPNKSLFFNNIGFSQDVEKERLQLLIFYFIKGQTIWCQNSIDNFWRGFQFFDIETSKFQFRFFTFYLWRRNFGDGAFINSNKKNNFDSKILLFQNIFHIDVRS